jgi:hypothetical protein
MEINFTNPAAALPHCKFASDLTATFDAFAALRPFLGRWKPRCRLWKKITQPGAKGSVFIP